MKNLFKKPLSIFISHTNPLKGNAGTEKYITEEIKLLGNKINIIQIYPYYKRIKLFGFIKITLKRAPFKYYCYGINLNNKIIEKNLSFQEIEPILQKAKDNKNFISLNIHHLLNWQNEIVNKIITIFQNKKIITYLHDVYCVNPQSFLNKKEVSEDKIKECKSNFKKLFQESFKIIYPSYIVEEVLLKEYGKFLKKDQLLCFEHQKFSKTKNKKIAHNNNKIKIAFLAYKSLTKGWECFQRLAQDDNLKETLEFYHIGSKKTDLESNPKAISYSSINNENAAIDVLLKNKIDLVLLWSIVPETYSYTMHETAAAGIPILTNTKSGNIYYKINNKSVYGKMFNNEEELINFLNDKKQIDNLINNNPSTHLYNLEYQSIFEKILTNRA